MSKKRDIFVTVMSLILLVCLGGCTLVRSGPGASHAANEDASLSLESSVAAGIALSKQRLAGQFGDDFVGFSIEPRYLCQFLALEQQSSTLDQLYRNFAPMIIRIGGNSMDLSLWQPERSCNGLTFGRSTIDDVFGFATRVNARIIWGINLRSNTTASAVNEAAYVATVGGSRLLGFELGNEPRHWSSGANFMNRWETYAAAIAMVVPHASLTGPAMYDYGGRIWFNQFIEREHGRLMRVTYHYYPLHIPSDPATYNAPSVAHLLGPTIMNQTASNLRRVVHQAGAYGLPLEVAETNSSNQGGTPGVSDVFAAALWAADELFTAADSGVAAVNFHSNGGTRSAPPYVDTYAPIALEANSDVPYARPEYYGMLFFHAAAEEGGAPLKTDVTSAANVSAHALQAPDGSLQIAIINKDSTRAVRATVNVATFGTSYRSGSAMRLQASSLVASQGITLAGTSVGTDGTWTARSSESVSLHNSSLDIIVPAGSAVLITLTT